MVQLLRAVERLGGGGGGMKGSGDTLTPPPQWAPEARLKSGGRQSVCMCQDHHPNCHPRRHTFLALLPPAGGDDVSYY